MRTGRLSRGALLLLLAAAQAFASTGQLLHLCRMREEPRACHCPHRAAQDEVVSSPGATVEAAPCCDRHVIDAAQAPATFERRDIGISLTAAPSPALPEPPVLTSHRAPREHLPPPAHGPPLYLRVRSLLI